MTDRQTGVNKHLFLSLQIFGEIYSPSTDFSHLLDARHVLLCLSNVDRRSTTIRRSRSTSPRLDQKFRRRSVFSSALHAFVVNVSFSASSSLFESMLDQQPTTDRTRLLSQRRTSRRCSIVFFSSESVAADQRDDAQPRPARPTDSLLAIERTFAQTPTFDVASVGSRPNQFVSFVSAPV